MLYYNFVKSKNSKIVVTIVCNIATFYWLKHVNVLMPNTVCSGVRFKLGCYVKG